MLDRGSDITTVPGTLPPDIRHPLTFSSDAIAVEEIPLPADWRGGLSSGFAWTAFCEGWHFAA